MFTCPECGSENLTGPEDGDVGGEFGESEATFTNGYTCLDCDCWFSEISIYQFTGVKIVIEEHGNTYTEDDETNQDT